MRIVLINPVGQRIGGVEVYLQHLAPALRRRGHDVALLHEQPFPPGGEPIHAPGEVTWCVAESGVDAVLDQVRRWGPDLIYAHQLIGDGVLGPLQAAWPSLYFAHTYVGVCISGGKCWKWPRPRVCQRTLGWGCLLHYFPHGCGGLNPRVMWRLFHQQRADQQRLRRFQSLVTHSEYVREEYLRHGFASDHVTRIPFWVPGQPSARPDSGDLAATGPVRLLFLGRCEEVKGGGVLLEALPLLARRLGRRVELTLAGEGPRRDHWMEMARRLMSSHPQVGIELPGWLGLAQRNAALGAAHVIVVPSLWPEPFGMIGIEAGFHSVPAVAFDVGGVREWLTEGVNGHFATGVQPTAEGLADALARVFVDAAHYRGLRAGALEATGRFTEAAHLDALTACMDRCHAEGVRR